jgi:hypothetical protein
MSRPWKEMGRYGSVGIELILSILILTALGHWLDVRFWHDAGYATAAGFLLGAAVGFRNLFRTAKHMQRDIERAEANDPEAGRWKVDEGWLHQGDDVAPDPDSDHTRREKHDDDSQS